MLEGGVGKEEETKNYYYGLVVWREISKAILKHLLLFTGISYA